MTTSPQRFHVNRDRVAAKVIDGEAIVIDLVSGAYYSLTDAGGRMWELVDAGASVADVARQIALEYDVTADQALADTTALVARLLADQLVVARTEETPADRAAALPASDRPRAPYRAPDLQVYRDMEELLALDPPMPGLGDVSWE